MSPSNERGIDRGEDGPPPSIASLRSRFENLASESKGLRESGPSRSGAPGGVPGVGRLKVPDEPSAAGPSAGRQGIIGRSSSPNGMKVGDAGTAVHPAPAPRVSLSYRGFLTITINNVAAVPACNLSNSTYGMARC